MVCNLHPVVSSSFRKTIKNIFFLFESTTHNRENWVVFSSCESSTEKAYSILTLVSSNFSGILYFPWWSITGRERVVPWVGLFQQGQGLVSIYKGNYYYYYFLKEMLENLDQFSNVFGSSTCLFFLNIFFGGAWRGKKTGPSAHRW